MKGADDGDNKRERGSQSSTDSLEPREGTRRQPVSASKTGETRDKMWRRVKSRRKAGRAAGAKAPPSSCRYCYGRGSPLVLALEYLELTAPTWPDNQFVTQALDAIPLSK